MDICEYQAVDKNGDGDLASCTTLELIDKIRKLKVQVKQLRNVIHKGEQLNSTDVPMCKKAKRERPFNFDMQYRRHVALKVAYLGWDYHGLASQEDSNHTIEAHLFNALLRTKLIKSRETANYQRCGRTDKGVSAFSQVLSLTLRCKSKTGIGVLPPLDQALGASRSPSVDHSSNAEKQECNAEEVEEINYPLLLNKVLPKEIRVTAWAPVPSNFSARFSCVHRTYKYYFPAQNLDTKRLLEAASFLVGVHDFRNFCKMDRTGKQSPVREIFEVTLEDASMDVVALRIKARSFVWHQIRCIVAILLLVGKGLEEPNIVSKLLDVERCPSKPQYSMAVDFPLVLFDVDHGEVPWIIDTKVLEDVKREFKAIALQHRIKAAMINGMLVDLPLISCDTGNPTLIDTLLMGKEAKVYKPLMSRPLCKHTPEDSNPTSTSLD